MEEKKLIYPGQTVCVMGLGVTGRAAVKYCLAQGAQVRVSDARDNERFLAEEGEFLDATGVAWEAGGHTLDFCSTCKVLLPSPGIDLRKEIFVSLETTGVQIAGELAVVAGEIEVPIVAVTGTNGKTTVTSLIGEVLSLYGRRVFVGGNIGTPLYEYCLSPKEYDVVVVEVSSFQLESSGDFAADVAVLLNISPDHLDRHGTIENYAEAKGRIFSNMGENSLAVVNGDDHLCRSILPIAGAQILTFGRGDMNNLCITDTSFLTRKGENVAEEFAHGLCRDIGFTGYNLAAAYAALKEMGLTGREIATGFRQFKGLPHRLEVVAKKNDVTFINDSKATNTGAVVGALQEMPKGVILIAGGRGKGEDYSVLRKSVEEKVHTLVLIGEAATKLKESLGDVTNCIPASSMEDAVSKASQAARPKDTVLLSPACASFDMFTSYGNRGDVFKKIVLDLSD
ncbi:UDP-N-acetylmuramoyl-L-alanine--D-glutamate ligase [Desulforhopalus sp. 52FAK]